MVPYFELCPPTESCDEVSCEKNEANQFSHVDRSGLGISIPACLTGSLVIPCIGTLVVDPLKKARRKDFLVPPPPGGSPPQCAGWRTVKNPTPDGGNFSDQHKMSKDIGAPPRTTPLPSLCIPSPSPITTYSMTTGHLWIRQCSGFRWSTAIFVLILNIIYK